MRTNCTKILGLLSFVALLNQANGQSLDLNWVNTSGGSSSDYCHSVDTDTQGNVFAYGRFQGTVDFDPGPGVLNLTSNGAFDNYIAKYTPTGSLIWAKSFGGPQGEMSTRMVVDEAGDVIMTGSFFETVDFDPGPGVYNLSPYQNLVWHSDIFVLKLDQNGNFLWANVMGGADSDLCWGLTVDQSNNIYVSGHFAQTVDLDPGPGIANFTSNGSFDTFIQKLSHNGDMLWTKQTGGTGSDVPWGLDVDTLGNVYSTGHFFSTVDFDPGAGVSNGVSNGSLDIYIQKLDTAGNFVWVRTFGGSGLDQSQSIEVRPDGSVYTVGHFSSTVDFNPGLGTSFETALGNEDAFVQKLDASGNFEWAKAIQGMDFEYLRGVSVNDQEHVFVVGYFWGTADFEPGSGVLNYTSQGTFDAFMQEYSPSGDMLWTEFLGGTEANYGYDVLVNQSNELFAVGAFGATVDFDVTSGTANESSNGSRDAYVVKYNRCSNYITQQVSACNSYTWAANNVTYHNSGIHQASLSNMLGCDSIVILELEIGYTDTTSTSETVCNTFFWPVTNQFYDSSGVYHAVFSNTSGCDSVVMLNLTVNYSGSSSDTVMACDSYTWAVTGATYTTGGIYDTVLTTTAGCDSLAVLHLTMNPVDTSVSRSDHVLQASMNGASYQWLRCSSDSGYIVLPNDTFQVLCVPQTGEYAVVVTNDNCTDTSSCHFVQIVGVGMGEMTNASTVQVFPNPASGHCNVRFEQVQESATISLTSLSGSTISVAQFRNTRNVRLNLPPESGIYFIQVQTDSAIQSFRVVNR